MLLACLVYKYKYIFQSYLIYSCSISSVCVVCGCLCVWVGSVFCGRVCLGLALDACKSSLAICDTVHIYIAWMHYIIIYINFLLNNSHFLQSVFGFFFCFFFHFVFVFNGLHIYKLLLILALNINCKYFAGWQLS